MQDILDFPNFDTCHCRVIGYIRSHSFMEIKVDYIGVNTSEDVFYIAFEGVEYFEGPMIWQGGQFRIMSPIDCLNLLHKLGRYEGIPDEYLLKRFQLITNPVINPLGSNLHVRILASNSIVSSSQSPYFPRTPV